MRAEVLQYLASSLHNAAILILGAVGYEGMQAGNSKLVVLAFGIFFSLEVIGLIVLGYLPKERNCK